MRKRYFLVGSLLFLSFVFFSYLVAKEAFVQFDFDTTVKLQDNISRRFDPYFSFLSDIGVFEITLGALIIFILALRKIRGLLAIGFFGLFHLIELFGKVFVGHLPPPEFMLRTERIMNFPQFHVRLENSYPSGHAGRAAFLTVLIGAVVFKSRINKYLKIAILAFLIAYDIAMFVSRPYLGEHWASDVVGGALLGASLGILSFFAYLKT